MGRPAAILADLQARLSSFDGRNMTVLGEAEAVLGKDPAYLDAVVALAADGEGRNSAGVTWLLKSALENGRALSAPQRSNLLDCLPRITDWAAQLHVCQSVRYLAITEGEAARLGHWLVPILSHDRPFLRAWSLDAMGHVARANSRFAEQFAAALDAGLADGAASVRARARQVQKESALSAGGE